MATQGGTPAAVGHDGDGHDGHDGDGSREGIGLPTGSGRRFGWRRRRPAPVQEPPTAVVTDGDRIIVVPSADFVCCSYKGCGALRPLIEVNENRPCAGCGRV